MYAMDEDPGQPTTERINLAEITSVDVHELFPGEDPEYGFCPSQATLLEESPAGGSEVGPVCSKDGDALLVITTSPAGHNLGRTYIQRLGRAEAGGWQQDLIRLAQTAQAHAAGQRQRGCGVLSSLRARALAVHDSQPFQFCVALLIVAGCGLDVLEV